MMVFDGPEKLDFSGLIKPGDTVVFAQGPAEPSATMAEMMAQRHAIGPFTAFIGPSYTKVLQPEHGDVVSFKSYCGVARNGLLMAHGALDIVPTHYSALPALFSERRLAADVVVLTLTQRGADNHFNVGLSHDYLIAAARQARLVIAQVSDRLPWTFGGELPSDIQPDILIYTSAEPVPVQMPGLDDASAQALKIAEFASSVIPDGATLEFGVGLLPELVMRALRNHRNLGIHSGMIGDGIVDLIECGAVTNTRKPLYQGVTVGGMLLGTRKLWDFAHNNNEFLLVPASSTHNVSVLRELPYFTAINGTLEVDITGQVNSEIANGAYIGAVGGQVDFVRGANESFNGRSIMVLPSVNNAGTVSRIVPKLSASVVSTSRNDVDTVVTEWGVAELRGKTLKERTKALIAIAHPKFRESLEAASHSPI